MSACTTLNDLDPLSATASAFVMGIDFVRFPSGEREKLLRSLIQYLGALRAAISTAVCLSVRSHIHTPFSKLDIERFERL